MGTLSVPSVRCPAPNDRGTNFAGYRFALARLRGDSLPSWETGEPVPPLEKKILAKPNPDEGVVTRTERGRREGGDSEPRRLTSVRRYRCLGPHAFDKVSSVRGISVLARFPPPMSEPPSLGAGQGGQKNYREPRVSNPPNRCQLDGSPRKWPKFVGTQGTVLLRDREIGPRHTSRFARGGTPPPGPPDRESPAHPRPRLSPPFPEESGGVKADGKGRSGIGRNVREKSEEMGSCRGTRMVTHRWTRSLTLWEFLRSGRKGGIFPVFLRSRSSVADTLCRWSIASLPTTSSSFRSLFRVLCIFPLRYLYAIGLPPRYLALGGVYRPIKVALPSSPNPGHPSLWRWFRALALPISGSALPCPTGM